MKIGVILGSVRKGRAGEKVAKWVMRRLSEQTGIEAELIDLIDYPLPFYAEDMEPVQNKEGVYSNDVAPKWAAKIGEMDGFIFVAPEYNHSFSAPLKNALDYLYYQWVDKPVSFVSYSTGPIGGARMVEQLRATVANLGLIDLAIAVHVGKVHESIDEEGMVISGPYDGSFDRAVTQLLEWTEMLNKKRAKTA